MDEQTNGCFTQAFEGSDGLVDDELDAVIELIALQDDSNTLIGTQAAEVNALTLQETANPCWRNSGLRQLSAAVDAARGTPTTTASDLNSEPNSGRLLEALSLDSSTVGPPASHADMRDAKLRCALIDKEKAEARNEAYEAELSEMQNQAANNEVLLEQMRLSRDLVEAKFFEQGIELGDIARELNHKLCRAVRDKEIAEKRNAAYEEELNQMQLDRDLAEAKVYALADDFSETTTHLNVMLRGALQEKAVAEGRHAAYREEWGQVQKLLSNMDGTLDLAVANRPARREDLPHTIMRLPAREDDLADWAQNTSRLLAHGLAQRMKQVQRTPRLVSRNNESIKRLQHAARLPTRWDARSIFLAEQQDTLRLDAKVSRPLHDQLKASSPRSARKGTARIE